MRTWRTWLRGIVLKLWQWLRDNPFNSTRGKISGPLQGHRVSN